MCESRTLLMKDEVKSKRQKIFVKDRQLENQASNLFVGETKTMPLTNKD